MAEGYSAGDLARLLGLTPAKLKGLLRAALPGAAEREHFSFQDLVLLRTAKNLTSSNVPSTRIRKALQRLRDQIPEDRPLTGVSLAADGDKLVARDGETRWQPESGQVLMDLGGPALAAVPAVAPEPELEPAAESEVTHLSPVVEEDAEDETGGLSADEWYELGCELEEAEPQRALGAYRRALAVDGGHADAHVNLGRLLQVRGDPKGAESHYRAALRMRPGDATAAYNLGTALEDQGLLADAITAYARAISANASYADAHYNLARLYERTGQKVAALRHLKTARQIGKR
jgi:tetratricopeptide (TPR) repeat protein